MLNMYYYNIIITNKYDYYIYIYIITILSFKFSCGPDDVRAEGEELCSVILRQCVWEVQSRRGQMGPVKVSIERACPQAPAQLPESTETEGKVRFTYLKGRQVTYVSELLILHRGDLVFGSWQTCPCVNDRQIKEINGHLRGLSDGHLLNREAIPNQGFAYLKGFDFAYLWLAVNRLCY